ncbi:Ig-like domain-containing protein [Cellulosilyticum ruminicola]|uniref:Ig-like domain-containing protein n=1 Tax=Cellulosilyticum ruminicola TaxID=425254 RepID=UPI0006D0F21A|nr:Ig-like domain-containing protein [Cellulosilyticum ruminicola]
MINKKKHKMLTLFLSLILICSMQGVSVFGATIGERLLEPETGWQRIDDTNEDIVKYGTWYTESLIYNYNGSASYIKGNVPTQKVMSFMFYGSQIRIISGCYSNRTTEMTIYIDGVKVGKADESQPSGITQNLIFEKKDMVKDIHKVDIYIEDSKPGMLDAIDIDSDGYMIPYQEDTLNIKEDSISIQQNENRPLVLEVNSYIYTTSSALWISSDEAVAKVDSNGVVTGISEGVTTITAYIEGTDLTDSCQVDVIKENTPIYDCILKIELIDDNIKEFNVTSNEVTDFIQWFKDRDRDDTEVPFYKFVKSNGTSVYVVHNKIVAFEVIEN